jgi:molybdopterin converting factor small subunit
MNVCFFGSVLDYTNIEKSCTVKNCSSIRELVDELGCQYGEQFKDFLLGDETCFFLVNGKGLMLTGGLDTKIKPCDKIEVLPFTDAG